MLFKFETLDNKIFEKSLNNDEIKNYSFLKNMVFDDEIENKDEDINMEQDNIDISTFDYETVDTFFNKGINSIDTYNFAIYFGYKYRVNDLIKYISTISTENNTDGKCIKFAIDNGFKPDIIIDYLESHYDSDDFDNEKKENIFIKTIDYNDFKLLVNEKDFNKYKKQIKENKEDHEYDLFSDYNSYDEYVEYNKLRFTGFFDDWEKYDDFDKIKHIEFLPKDFEYIHKITSEYFKNVESFKCGDIYVKDILTFDSNGVRGIGEVIEKSYYIFPLTNGKYLNFYCDNNEYKIEEFSDAEEKAIEIYNELLPLI